MKKTTLTLALITSLVSLCLTTTTFAGPDPHHGGPAMHAPVHPHPAPRPHFGYRHHYYHHHGGSIVAPLFLGALLVGSAVAASQATATTVQPTVVNVEPAVTPTTRFWCESEKGFYPEVRACPLGWTPINQ